MTSDGNESSAIKSNERSDLHAALCDQCISLIWEGLTKQPGFSDNKDDFRFELKYWLDRDSALRCQICSRAQAILRESSIEVVDWSWYCFGKQDMPNRKTMLVHLVCRYREHDDAGSAVNSVSICKFDVWPTVHNAVDRMLQCLQLDPPHQVVVSGHEMIDELHDEVFPDIAIIETWLDSCNDSHASCLPMAKDRVLSWIPDRLVHCDMQDGQYRFRLMRKDLEADMLALRSMRANGSISYIALSYCWGTPICAQEPHGGRTVLTKDRLVPWSQDIPVHSLGRTLLHALRLTIELGYRLIWIDSLCILQDSVEDWAAQSSHMSEIYQHADLVVAALSAESIEEGLLQRYSVLPVSKGFQCDISRWLQNRSGRRRTVVHAKILNGESFEREWRVSLAWEWCTGRDQRWPLQTRAWAFQEYQMARRVLAIHSTGYFCHCEEDNICSTPEQRPMKHGALKNYIAQHGQESLATGSTGSLEKFGDLWQAVVAEYSRTSLTVQTDRLLAVSAIAKALASQGGTGKYLAGLWEIHGCRGLTWSTSSGWLCPPRQHWGSDEYIAPSWSWLSVPGGIDYRKDDPTRASDPDFTRENAFTDRTRFEICQLVSHGIKTKTDFAFGQVEAGFLRIRGLLVHIIRTEYRMRGIAISESATGHPLETGVDVSLYPDTAEDQTIITRNLASCRWLPVVSCGRRIGEVVLTGLLVLETDKIAYTSPFGELDGATKVYRRIGKCEGIMNLNRKSFIPFANRIFEHAEGVPMEQFFSSINEGDLWHSDDWPDCLMQLTCQSRNMADLILV